MIEFKNTEVHGMHRILSARRSFNSLEKSDSIHEPSTNTFVLGPNDAKLFGNLIKSGDSHAKVTRMIWVWVDIRAPRRFWVDFDTYKLGRIDIHPTDIEMMSDSTMHTITKRPLTKDDFAEWTDQRSIDILNEKIEHYNKMISLYPENKSELLMGIKDNLLEGFMQERTVNINYQTGRHIYFDREYHRMPEMRATAKWLKTLPYARELITIGREK